MSFKNSVLTSIQNRFGNKTFTTRELASAMGVGVTYVSSALSQLRLNDRKIKAVGTTRGSDGIVLRTYQLIGAVANGPTFAQAAIAQNAPEARQAPSAFAAKLGALVASTTPVKALSSYTDDELFAEIKRRLGQ